MKGIKWILKKIFGINIEFPKEGDSYIFITDDKRKAELYARVDDLWGFIFEVKNNTWRQYKHVEPPEDQSFIETYKDLIYEELKNHRLTDIDEI